MRALTDQSWGCAPGHAAEYLSRYGHSAFQYYFVHTVAADPTSKWVAHADDLFYDFGITGLLAARGYGAPEATLSTNIRKYYLQFMTVGSPEKTATLAAWPSYGSAKNYMVLDTDTSYSAFGPGGLRVVSGGLRPERCGFMNQYINKSINAAVVFTSKASQHSTNMVHATISLAGVTAVQFTPPVQQIFKATIVTGLAKVLPSINVNDVTIGKFKDVRRGSLSVPFSVDVGSTHGGLTSEVSSRLSTFLKDTTSKSGFLQVLKANVAAAKKAGTLKTSFPVTGVTVTSAPSASSGSSSSDDGTTGWTNGWWYTVIVVLGLLGLCTVCGGLFMCFGRQDTAGDGVVVVKVDTTQADQLTNAQL